MEILHAIVSCSWEVLCGRLLVLPEGLRPLPLLLHLLIPVGLVCEEGVEGHGVDIAKGRIVLAINFVL